MQKYKNVLNAPGRQHLLIALIAFRREMNMKRFILSLCAGLGFAAGSLAEESDRHYLTLDQAVQVEGSIQARQDISVMGEQKISVGGFTYDRGIGVHSDSTLVFPLKGRFGTFHVVPGPDDAHHGAIVMKILLDGKEVFTTGAARSAGYVAPELDIPVTGVEELTLIVNDADGYKGGDHASWADAYLLPVGHIARQDASPLVASWGFEENTPGHTLDMAGKKRDLISGYTTRAEGVSGRALKFEGFNSKVVRKAADVPPLDNGFGFEAWIAPQVYPGNWAAILNQESERKAGWFFGMGGDGTIGLHIAKDGTWIECNSTSRLPLLQWSHVAGSYDPASGLKVYINGRLENQVSTIGAITPASDVDLWLGQSHTQTYPIRTDRELSISLLSPMVFEGLMDEVKIYRRAVGDDKVAGAFAAVQPKVAQPLQDRVLPPGVAQTAKHPQRFVEGIRGKALLFDGYFTEYSVAPEQSPVMGDRFTISAWVAPQEYSYNLSAIINRQQNFQKGYFFGINQIGQLVGSLALESGWTTVISTSSLPLLKWSNVAMVYDGTKGITLYLDGQEVGHKAVTGSLVTADAAPTIIGKTQERMTPAMTERESSRAVKSWMRFDGLIDELDVRGEALSGDDIREAFQKTTVKNIQPLQFRRMPSGTDDPQPFGAYYTQLTYAPGWDALWQGSDRPDVVVRFDDSPVKLVFWRGTGYIPALVSENDIWMSDQSCENWGSGECFEVMSDKQCRYSHIRIIENCPARAVIHWRYPLTSITYEIFKQSDTYPGDWADEYWTVYPDGVAVRKQVLWCDFDKPQFYQFQETIFFNQPGTRPQDNVELEAITLMDMNGKMASYSWEHGLPKSFPEPAFKPIRMVNFKSKYRPFSIHHPEQFATPFHFGSVKGYSTFPCWNHWPVSQIPSDGRNAQAFDKPSSTSIAYANADRQQVEHFPDGSIRARMLKGMTTNSIESLLPLARSWNFPPQLETQSAGFANSGYDPYERAYHLERLDSSARELVCDIQATPESPIVNLCLVVKNWGDRTAGVEVNGETIPPGDSFRYGLRRGLEGTDLVVWLKQSTTEPVRVVLQ